MNTVTVIEVRTSPHLHVPRSVDTIMRNVVYALLPICAYAVWLFGHQRAGSAGRPLPRRAY